jgi:hypothetical protein
MTTDPAKPPGSKPSDDDGHAALPGIDFSTFVLSLATSAMVHMGLVPDPDGGATQKNLALARQSIDTLEMLQQKTRGNLSDDETHLLQSVLYQLRMDFVKARG